MRTLLPRPSGGQNPKEFLAVKSMFFAAKHIAVAAFAALAGAASAAAFTPGNLVVLQIGDGTTSVSGASVPVFLNEYTVAGASVQQIPIPSTTAGARLTVTGSSTSSGHLSLSTDGQYIVFGGFDLPAGTFAASSTTTASRVIARVAMNGTVDISTNVGYNTGTTFGFSGGDLRSVVSVDGTGFWAAGNSTGGGIRYVPFGQANNATSVLVSGAPANDRVALINNGQLYMSSASTSVGINIVGTGLPTTPLPVGATQLLAATSDAYGFAFTSSTRMLVADNTAGLRQFDLSGGTWGNTNTFASAGGLRGLALGTVSGSPTLFVTDAQNSPNHLLSTSATSPGSFTTLATAPANAVLRGVVQIPSVSGVKEWSKFEK